MLTVLPVSAVPVKVGVASLVTLSMLEEPRSVAAVRSGVDGVAGAMVSFVKAAGADIKPQLVAPSLPCTRIVCEPWLRLLNVVALKVAVTFSILSSNVPSVALMAKPLPFVPTVSMKYSAAVVKQPFPPAVMSAVTVGGVLAALGVTATPDALGLQALASYVGVAPGVGVGPTVGVGGGASGAPRASATSMRPKAWPLIGLVALITWSCAAVLLLPSATSRAASPATSAAEAEVPL